MLTQSDSEVIDIIKNQGECSSKEVFDNITSNISYATLKRNLTKLVFENYIITKGKGKGTKYLISPSYGLLYPIDIEAYYKKEIDERDIQEGFNFQIISEILDKHRIFTNKELEKLKNLQNIYKSNIAQLSDYEYKKELERLAIDLSWKSSQIEGNTYSLLETEKLLKEKETAAGKTKEEAVMLLNHKETIDFIMDNPDYLSPLSVLRIEDIHGMLTKELAVERNLRKRRIGISGTNYRPLDNEFRFPKL